MEGFRGLITMARVVKESEPWNFEDFRILDLEIFRKNPSSLDGRCLEGGMI